MNKFNNTLEVSYGTDFIKEVDNSLEILMNNNLVLSIQKLDVVDGIKYTIEFSNVEGAFLFGLSRPQIKIF